MRKIFVAFFLLCAATLYANQHATPDKTDLSGEQSYQEGILLFKANEFHDAFHLFEKALKDKKWFNKRKAEEQGQIYQYMALSLYNDEKYGEAILWFDQAIHFSTHLKQAAYLYRGICLYEVKKIEEALSDLKKAAALKTDASLNKIAIDYIKKIEVQTFKRPVFIEEKIPQKDKERYSDGLKNLQDGQFQKAETDILNYSEIDPENYQALYALGIVYSKKNEYGKSIEYLQKSIDLAPQDIKPFYEKNLGSVYFLAGKDHLTKKAYTEAAASFLKATQTEVWFESLTQEMQAQAIYYIAHSYFEEKNFRNANIYFRKLFSYEAEVKESAYYYLGMAAIQQGQKESALLHFKKLLRLYPKSKFTKQANGYIDNIQRKGVFSGEATASLLHDSNAKTQPEEIESRASSEQFEIHYKNHDFLFEQSSFDLSYSVHHKTYWERRARTSDSLRNSIDFKMRVPFYFGIRLIDWQPSVNIALSHSGRKIRTQSESIGMTLPFALAFSDFWNPNLTYTVSLTNQHESGSTITEDIRDGRVNSINIKNTSFLNSKLISTFSIESTGAFNKTKGGNFDYREFEGGASLGGSLIWDFSYNTSTKLTYTKYQRHRQNRHDFKKEHTATLSRQIFHNLSSSLNFTRTVVDSNLPSFTYSRSLITFTLNYTLF